MGVQNLWMLLAPVGRQIEIESLAGQVLAVDASIWLTQFVKAMRDDEGNMIRNAHLMGTLYRVAKLLFYGVRPVFVFDGQTPEIKKRTTARRRRRQEQQTANLRHTAQRILLNRLKQQRQEVQKSKSNASTPAVASGFTLPEVGGSENKKKKDEEEEETKGEDEEEVNREDGGRNEEDETAIEQEEALDEKGVQMVWEAAAKLEEESGDLTLDDVELDTSRLSKIDLHAVFSLPPHLQKDMIQKILRDRRQEVRNQFIPLAGKPEKYSHAQISAFLQTSSLNRRIDVAKRKKRQEEMENQGGVGQGHRIDSNCNRFYIYQKNAERKEDTNRNEDKRKEVKPIDVTERSSANEPMQPHEAQIDAFEVDQKGPSSTVVSERVECASDANAKEIATALVARYQVRVKQEPVLAIEKLRLSRLKKEGLSVTAKPSAVGIVAEPLPSSSVVSIVLKSDDVDPEEIARFQKQFPACKTERVSAEVGTTKIDLDDDDDDDVDWEEAASSTLEQSKTDVLDPESAERHTLNFHAEVQPSSSVEAASVQKSESEECLSNDAIEWDEVDDKAMLVDASDDNVKAVYRDDQCPGLKEQHSPDIHAWNEQNGDYNVDDVQNTDEEFLTLEDEIEEAKGHEDLNLLKDEALQSAMTTASNLTQWAAGAVRRALQAHSLQHGKTVESYKHSAAARNEIEIQDISIRDLAKDSRQTVNKNDKWKFTVDHTQNTTEVVIIDEENDASPRGNDADKEVEDGHKQLQAALAASIANERIEVAANTDHAPVRYLQYTQPNDSPQPSDLMDIASSEMDIAALQKEQHELRKLRSRQSRDTEGISDDMVSEVMALLRLFGVPFLVSPMEAEAQCAALEQLGLVDGVITDDSDIFPFGGMRVYKNIFHHQKFVEAFYARDVERELGFSREQLIAFALLLGSDYTDGVRGIGIVNATEIAAAYPGIEGLREFKEWVTNFDVAEEAHCAAFGGYKKKKVNKENDKESSEGGGESDGDTARERFQRSHAGARRKWELGDEFPNKQVVQAYMAPQVDRSDARFSWSAPDLAALRNYCANAFGWDQQKSDGVLQPLEEKAKAASISGNRHIQTRLDRFFTSYDDRVHFAQIKSKRLRSAVSQSTNSKKKKRK